MKIEIYEEDRAKEDLVRLRLMPGPDGSPSGSRVVVARVDANGVFQSYLVSFWEDSGYVERHEPSIIACGLH